MVERFSKFKILRHDPGKQIPLHVQIDLCGICNHSCVFCFSNPALYNTGLEIEDPKKHPYLSTDICLTLIDDLSAMGTRAVTLSGGGEPLFHNDTGMIISRLIENKLLFGIITNLTVNAELEELAMASWIRVSADAATAETYSKIHRTNPAEFNRMLENARRLSRHTELGVQLLITPENYQEIALAARVFRDAGAAYIEFKPPVTCEKGADLDDITDRIKELLQEARELQTSDFQVHDQIELIKSMRDTGRPGHCRITRHTAVVGCNAEVYSCCITKYNSGFSIGSLKTDRFADIWKRAIAGNLISTEKCPPCFYDNTNRALAFLDSECSVHDFFV